MAREGLCLVVINCFDVNILMLSRIERYALPFKFQKRKEDKIPKGKGKGKGKKIPKGKEIPNSKF